MVVFLWLLDDTLPNRCPLCPIYPSSRLRNSHNRVTRAEQSILFRRAVVVGRVWNGLVGLVTIKPHSEGSRIHDGGARGPVPAVSPPST